MRVEAPAATLETVAAELGVTRERTRQIERAALERVRTVRAWLRMQHARLGSLQAVAERERLDVRTVAAFVDLELPAPEPEPQRQRTGPSLAAE